MMQRKEKALVLFAAAAIILMMAAPCWADPQGSPSIPSSLPWVYDFGTGWLTIEMRGYVPGIHVVFKRIDPKEENDARAAIQGLKTLIAAVQIFQSSFPDSGKVSPQGIGKFDGFPNPMSAGTENSGLIIELRFKDANNVPPYLFLIPDTDTKNWATDSLKLDTKKALTVQKGLFDLDLTRPQTKDSTAVILLQIRKWPLGDPKIGT
jgi:hypothetical protein